MRGPIAVVAAAATAAGAVLAASGGASATTLPLPNLTPLPSVSVGLPTNPVPTPSTTPDPGDVVDDVTEPLTGGGDGGGDTGSGGTSPDSTAGDASGPTATGGSSAGSSPKRAATTREQRARDATPVVAGTAAARDLVDDEHSPAMRAAGAAFLRADEAIAEVARQKRVMVQLKQSAEEQAAVYQALDADVVNAESVATDFHTRYDSVRHEMVRDARVAYVTGRPTTDDGTAQGLFDAVGRLRDGSTRADLRVGGFRVLREAARADFQRIADRYNAAKDRMETAERLIEALAAQRAEALQAVQAARQGDLAMQQARLVESGQLGAQIRTASAALARSGRTVQGTGELADPADGNVTSPYGMRFHPILHYRKLHTGTDFAGGSSAVRAADDGRVLMTVVSEAYGNFTVIDHGVVDGHRLTTAYAHQAAFLVHEGERVAKGEQIGVIGSTGFSTGPHLHFEVREDGTVVDPMTWLL